MIVVGDEWGGTHISSWSSPVTGDAAELIGVFEGVHTSGMAFWEWLDSSGIGYT